MIVVAIVLLNHGRRVIVVVVVRVYEELELLRILLFINDVLWEDVLVIRVVCGGLLFPLILIVVVVVILVSHWRLLVDVIHYVDQVVRDVVVVSVRVDRLCHGWVDRVVVVLGLQVALLGWQGSGRHDSHTVVKLGVNNSTWVEMTAP